MHRPTFIGRGCTFWKFSLRHHQYNFQADDDGGGGGVADEKGGEYKIPFYYELNSTIFFFWKTIFSCGNHFGALSRKLEPIAWPRGCLSSMANF